MLAVAMSDGGVGQRCVMPATRRWPLPFRASAYSSSTSPCSTARTAAWMRLRTPSFVKMLAM
jgi:hypothetical protein